MKNLDIQTGTDNPILRAKAKKIVDLQMRVGGKMTAGTTLVLGAFVQNMKKMMDDEKGLGLAAPQVGQNLRLCLCRLNAGSSNEVLFAMVNPEVLERSDGRAETDDAIWDPLWGKPKRGSVSPDGTVEIDEEGCLSLPSYYLDIARARHATVRFLDGGPLLKKGKAFKGELNELTLQLSGLSARVVQHEIDHLNGKLICDK